MLINDVNLACGFIYFCLSMTASVPCPQWSGKTSQLNMSAISIRGAGNCLSVARACSSISPYRAPVHGRRWGRQAAMHNVTWDVDVDCVLQWYYSKRTVHACIWGLKKNNWLDRRRPKEMKNTWAIWIMLMMLNVREEDEMVCVAWRQVGSSPCRCRPSTVILSNW